MLLASLAHAAALDSIILPKDEVELGHPAGSAHSDPVRGRGATFRSGEVVGEYRLSRLLGSGAMAEVWAANVQNGGLARPVALKLVLGEYQRDPEYRRMFLDEAMVASTIRHPNVCEVRDLRQDQGLLFMVLELVIGDSLRGLLQSPSGIQGLPHDVAARIVSEACAGLHAAHEATDPEGNPLGVVHRDVSPPNILVSLDGQVKISDFGIAKARVQYHTRTRTGDIKGNFAYIAPEQALSGRVDRRADVHSLGCVLYLATVGRRPFGGGPQALGRVVRGEYQLPCSLDPTYPKPLQSIVVRALATEPHERFQTADEMRLALEEWLVSEGRLVLPSDVATVVRQRIDPEQRKLLDFLSTHERRLPRHLFVGLANERRSTSASPPPCESDPPRPAPESFRSS